MKKYKKIVFVCQSGTARSQMAAAIMERQKISSGMEITAKGLVVLFPEPINQKAEAVIISNGIEVKNQMSEQLSEDDFDEETLVVAMDMKQKHKIYEDYSNSKNVRLLSEMAGEKGDIIDPYGGPLTGYGKCFEEINDLVIKMADRLNREENYNGKS